MKRSRRQKCKTCGKEDVAHYGGEPHGTHVKSERHKKVVRAVAPPSSDAAAHPAILGVADQHGEGRAS